MVIQDQSDCEAFTASFGELAQPGEIASHNRRRGFYFYSNHVASLVFHHDIDFVVVSIAETNE